MRQLNTSTKTIRDPRDARLLRVYGITAAQYDSLLAGQDHSCKICFRHEDEFKTRLAVDHDHHTGEIRGLLCAYCNHRLVGRWRDAELLRRIADYVEQGTGWFVPGKAKTCKKRKTKQKATP